MDRYFKVRLLVKDDSLRIKDIVKQTGYDKGHVSRLRKDSQLKKVIADAVAAEREACAKVVEDYCGAWDDGGYALASTIRVRGMRHD
jgi:hypothetical protein